MIWIELTAALEKKGNLGCDKGAICTRLITENQRKKEKREKSSYID